VNARLKYTLAIDLGTSGPKVALVSSHGEVAACEVEPTPVHFSPGGGAEQNPDDWWKAITTASKRLIAKKIVSVDLIEAVCCTSQWSGTVPVSSDGQHLSSAIIWMDSRGASHVKKVTGGLLKIEGYGASKLLHWLRLTGGIPGHSGKDSIAHILYIKSERPELYKSTYKFLEPKDYLNQRLTGKFAASYDSIALHWVTDNRDINNIEYSPRLLKMSGLDREKLPDLKSSIDILGPLTSHAARDLGVREGISVIMGTPDVQSAAIGSGAVRDFEGHLYIGTSSWLTCHVPFKKTSIQYNMATLPSGIPGRYFIGNEQETAGFCLTYLRDNVFYNKDEITPDGPPADAYIKFNKVAAQAPPGSNHMIFTPWLYGERTPVEDSNIRGAFFNLSLDTNRANIIRSVFEGVAYNSRWLLDAVESFINRKMETINMIGGGARSELWCQIHADVLNRRILQVRDPVQANARGAGFLAAVAMGHCTFEEIPGRIGIEKVFEPNPDNRKIYDDLFKEFKNIYAQNRKIYARLNRR